MTWETLFDEYTALIDRRLKNHFKSLNQEAGKYHSFILETYRSLEEYMLRKGKRLASCSTLLAYEGYAGDLDEKILKVGVGIELYRHSILIHDDLVDEDESRRGGKSFHIVVAGKRDRRFGDGVAVFMGDVVYALSLEAISNSGFSGDKLLKVFELISEDYRGVNESQVLDLLFEYKEPDLEEWYAMASKRAAALFKTTILTGAILGGASPDDLLTLREAAVNIGYAFDIQDDIIDAFATEQQYGRPPGRDMARGKRPLHFIYALKLAEPVDLRLFKDIVGKGKLGSEALETVRDILRKTGALNAAKARLAEHAKRAKELIGRTRMGEESKKFFSAFIDYIAKSLDWYK